MGTIIKKNIFIVKIVLSLSIAFVVVGFVSKPFFLANTPRLNKDFIGRLVHIPGLIAYRIQISLFGIPSKTYTPDFASIEKLPNSALIEISKGVFAKEEQGEIVYIRVTKDVEYEEMKVILDGKKTTIRVPKGTMK